MLEAASIRRPGLIQGRMDVGRILEAMLYYNRVHLHLDGQLFTGLWIVLGHDGIRDLLSHSSITSTVTAEFTAVHNQTIGFLTTHLPTFMTMRGDAKKFLKSSDHTSIFQQMLSRNCDDATRKNISSVLRLPEKSSYERLLGGIDASNDIFYSILSDSESMRMFIRKFAQRASLEVDNTKLDQIRFEGTKVDDGLILTSNYKPSDVYTNASPNDLNLNRWDNVLPLVHEYAIDLIIAGRYSLDVACSEEIGEIADQRMDIALRRGLSSAENISAFEQATIGSSRSFSEAFNAGELTLKDALKTIDRTQKFREWTSKLPPSADLLESYAKEIGRDETLDKLPAKSLRFALFTGAGIGLDTMLSGGGVIAAATTTALSACDTFLVDRFLKGWRPSSFVKTISKIADK